MANLKMKVLPKFPAQVLGGDGIVIDQTGGVFTISIDPAVLPDFTQQLDTAHGGTGQDWSGSSGIPLFTGGTGSLLASTGTGNVVRATSPTLTTPILGVATASSINGNIWTTGTGTLTLGAGKTATVSNTLTFSGTDGSSVAFGTGGTVAYGGGTLAQFAATTSAQLRGVLSDETGAGVAVFADTPTLITPVLGVATATTINGVALSNAAFTTSTPTVTASIGTFTSVSCSMRHIKIGRMVFFQAQINITTNGTAAGTIIVPLPAGLTAQGYWAAAGFNGSIGGALIGNIPSTQTIAVVANYDNTYPGADGQFLIISGNFEATT